MRLRTRAANVQADRARALTSAAHTASLEATRPAASEEAHDMGWIRARWRPRSSRMRWIRVQDGCAESPATAPSLTRKDAAQNGDKRAAALALRRRLLRRPGGRRGQRRHAGAGAAPSARALLCGRRRTDGANRPALRWSKLAQRYSNARAQHRDERVAVNSRVVLASSRRQGGAAHGQQRALLMRVETTLQTRLTRSGARAGGAACDALPATRTRGCA